MEMCLQLEKFDMSIMNDDKVVIVFIGTRPKCISCIVHDLMYLQQKLEPDF